MPFGIASKVSFGVRVRGRLRLQPASHVRAPRVQYCLPARTVILHCIRVFVPDNWRDQALGCLQVHQDQIWKDG